MESWVLEGNSYSFLCSSPHSFSLRHRDGPDRVEIFDITSIPNTRSAISETTCLCDIFGDDCESPSLSSSPTSASFLKRDLDEHLASEDVNDSSGSYRTAHSSEPRSDISDASEDPSSPQTDLILSNDKTALPSRIPTNVDNSDPSQTENQKELHLSLAMSPGYKVENTDSSAQQQIMSMSEFRDSNIRVTDSSQESMNLHLLSENRSITEETDMIPSQLREISTQYKLQESTFSEKQDHTITSESSDRSLQDLLKEKDIEFATPEASCDDNDVVAYPEEKDEKVLSETGGICCSPTEHLSLIQETEKGDCSTDLANFFPEDGDFTSAQRCLSTPNCSITAITPDSRGFFSSPVHNDIPFETDAIMEPKDTLGDSSSELMNLQSTAQTDDKARLLGLEDSYTVPSPTLTAEDNTEINLSSVPQTLTDSPDSRVEASPDHTKLSLLSDMTERTDASHKVSEFSSFADSSVAVHSEPSIIIMHSPVGYTISPSPDLGRKNNSPELENWSTPEITDDYTLTHTNFQGSLSSSDSKVCFTPESRSITATPESIQNITLESMPTAPSPGPRSVFCSPEIKTRSCSSPSQNPKSLQIEGITDRVVSLHQKLSQSPDAEGIRCAENSSSTLTNLLTNVTKNLSISPTSTLSSTPGSMSRPSSATLPRDSVSSPEIRDQRSPDKFSDHVPVLEPHIPVEQARSTLSTVVNAKVNFPSGSPIDDGGHFEDTECKESFKSCSLAVDKSIDGTSVALIQIQTRTNSASEVPDTKLSVLQMEESRERINTNTSDLITYEASNSVNTCHTSKEMADREIDSSEGKDNCSAPEMLARESVGREERLGDMPVKCRESPNVFHSDNNRGCERQPRNKGWSEEKAAKEKGAQNGAECSYRGEQVELSVSARNRKGPASHGPASLSPDPKSGIPARCYFESSLTTPQQSLLRAQSLQIKDKSCARRVQSAFQSNHSSAGNLPSECTSETSSMGSESDEADNEVKRFTDLGLRSLPSPQGDYLDVYNSSQRSSTNVSQPSTMESPGAVTWMSYADLHGSALHGKDFCHTSSFLPHGMLDPAKRFEMGSFECVDVAVESMEEFRRGRRTVPKRQIQLKRRNTDEPKSAEKADNVLNLPTVQRCSRVSLVRQHSTPAGVQEDLQEGEMEIQTDRKMLQKSASLDETSTKTKMASTIIKSVLSMKMETPTKESSKSESSSPSEDKKKQTETLPAGAPTHTENQILNSSLPSECSLSSGDSAGRDERNPRVQKKSRPPKVLPKPYFKANIIPTYSNTGVGPFQGKMSVKDKMTPRKADPFENNTPKKHVLDKREKGSKTSNVGEKYSSDSANAPARNTNSDASKAASMQNRMSNRDKGHPVTTENPKQQDSRRMFLSKTPEITLKPCNSQDKKKLSPKVSLSPDMEMSRDPKCESQIEETTEEQMGLISDVENEDNNETNRPKSVIHKVRDVRKLVKNTYKLSFTAPNTTNIEDPVTQQQKETQLQNPHALHIECKAISRKNKQESCNKPTSQQEETHSVDKSEISRVHIEMNGDTDLKEISVKPNVEVKTMLESQQKTTKDCEINIPSVPDKCNSISKSYDHCEQSSNLEMPPRPASKETSTLVFLQDSISKSTQKPVSPVLSDMKSSSHSVSMLLKEKGMQADIGVCDVPNEASSATPTHINKLEVPLQTCASEGTSSKLPKFKKDAEALSCEHNSSTDSTLQISQGASLSRSSTESKELRLSPSATQASPSKEEEKKLTTHATSVTKISALLETSNKAAVSSHSNNTKSQVVPVTTSKEVELPIQVRSISNDRPKPSVPPKLSYKQPFAEIRSISSDVPKTDITPTSSVFKQQPKCDKKNEMPATRLHQVQSTEAALSNTKKLSVSAVSLPLTSIFVQKSASSVATDIQQESNTSVLYTSNEQQENLNVNEEHVTAASCLTSQPVIAVASQAHTYAQPEMASSKNQLHKDDFQFYASDDPPSYDERESFSPLLLSDLSPRRLNRYHPTSKHSSCCCTTSHLLLGHTYHGSQNRTPPASHSPGQVLSYPGGPPQAQVCPHQCRPDGHPLNYPSVSPKTTVPKAPAKIQPLHRSHTCPAPVTQSHGDEQQPPPSQQMDRRSANLRSPQTASGAPYREHSRSPNIAGSQFFNTEDIPPAFGHDYGGDGPGGGGVLYPENASGLGYGQSPRRVLLDPETGKYFYIEVPVQPLRKMLFDPEMGQYVEVLIPQHAMSHSGMYPPTAAPYPSLHGPGLYAPQYLPYAVPPHAQSAPQPRHQEPSVSTSLHQTSVGFSNSANQMLKSEAKSLPALDSSYLESMYYIPTGVNASPNSPAPHCCHKRSPNLPPTGGRRA